jgi:hypothetical protein
MLRRPERASSNYGRGSDEQPAVVTMNEGECEGCNRHAVLTPLHGPEKGGPLRCYVCAGAWQAEHGRKRRTGRVVIRAMKAFLDAGGATADLDKMKIAALGHSFDLGAILIRSASWPRWPPMIRSC